jgi:hypothetical protein
MRASEQNPESAILHRKRGNCKKPAETGFFRNPARNCKEPAETPPPARQQNPATKSRRGAARISENFAGAEKCGRAEFLKIPDPENLPRTAEILENLGVGMTPNFLDVMTMISEIVDFYTDCDTNPVDTPEINFIMSQNKCRNCS